MKVVKSGKYEYLEYSYRKGNETHKIRKNVKNVSEIEDLKLDMLIKIFDTRWNEQVEIISKNYHQQFYSLPKPIQIKNLHNFGVSFTHNTNKIEGSSLSLKDVVGIINDKISPANKPVNDIFEAQKHMKVYELMCTEKFELKWKRVLNWHKILFNETKRLIAGIFRQYPVGIVGSKYTPPMYFIEIEMLLEDLLKFWNENMDRIHPVMMACLIHFRFVSIHPFGDGNGRISRVLMNYILYHSKYPMFDIDPKIRRTYYSALERANIKDDESVFLQWFMKHYLIENKKYKLNKK